MLVKQTLLYALIFFNPIYHDKQAFKEKVHVLMSWETYSPSEGKVINEKLQQTPEWNHSERERILIIAKVVNENAHSRDCQ